MQVLEEEFTESTGGEEEEEVDVTVVVCPTTALSRRENEEVWGSKGFHLKKSPRRCTQTKLM